MKKHLHLFLLLVLVAAAKPALADGTLLVNDGTDYSYDAPVDFWMTDTGYYRSQMIFTHDQIGALDGKVITQMKFFSVSTQNGPNANGIIVKVKIGITHRSAFPPSYPNDNNDHWDSSMTNTVMFGTVYHIGNEVIFYFNTGYYCKCSNPDDNLLVEIENVNIGYGQWMGSFPHMSFYGINGSPTSNLYHSAFKKSSNYPVTGPAALSEFMPKCEFKFSDKATYYPCVNIEFTGAYLNSRQFLSLNGNCRNQWIVGDSVHSVGKENYSLYVSGYPTLGNSYNGEGNAVRSDAFVYTFVDLEPNKEYTVSYDWRCMGERGSAITRYDYMRVALVNAGVSEASVNMIPGNNTTAAWPALSLPPGVISLDGDSALDNSDTWQHKTLTFRTPANDTHYKFVVYWHNDGSTAGSCAGAIDNIRITALQEGGFHDDFEYAGSNIWNWSTSSSDIWFDIGNLQHYSGGKSMYAGLLNNQGELTYSYDVNHSDTAITYFPIRLKAGQYLVSYNWKCQGEQGYDYMRVGLSPFNNRIHAVTGIPSGNIPCDGGTGLCGQNTWQYKSVIVNVPNDTVYNFYLLWRNDNSGGSGHPAAVDNLSIMKITPNLPVSFSYDNYDWEDHEKWQWAFASGAQKNQWTRGIATAQSGSSIYITDKSPFNYGYHYDNSSTSTVFAYTAINFNAGEYDLNFMWRNYGEGTSEYDHIRAILVPQDACVAPGIYTMPNDVITIGEYFLYGQNEYQPTTFTFTVPTAGVYRLAFMWRNDASDGTGVPGSVDEVTVCSHQAPSQYTITTNCNPINGGTVTGGGSYNAGATCTLTATANPGYHFTQWQDGNTSSTRSFTVTGDASFTAYFEATQGIDVVNGSVFLLYPNPANNTTLLNITGVTGDVMVSLHDINGRTVSERSFSCNGDCIQELDISTLAAGTYFVTVTTAHERSTKKIVVK